ncbi:MAG: T9SS type A sorting domain-containing protein [Calditrichia bacterium]
MIRKLHCMGVMVGKLLGMTYFLLCLQTANAQSLDNHFFNNLPDYTPLATDTTVSETEPNDDIATANLLLPGSSVEALINSAMDVDYYQLDIASPAALEITVVAIPFFSDLDPLLEILDANGNRLAFNDNSTQFETSQLVYEFTASGSYYIRVSNLEGTGGEDSLLYSYFLDHQEVIPSGNTSFSVLASLDAAQPVFALEKSEDIIYTAEAHGASIFRAIDVSDPLNPVELGSVQTAGFIYDIALYQNYAYLAMGTGATGTGATGIRIINTTDPQNLESIALISGFAISALFQQNDTLYAAERNGPGLAVYDLSDGAAPSLIWHFALPGSGALGVTVNANHIFLSGLNGTTYVIDKRTRTLISDLSLTAFVADSELLDNQLLLADLQGRLINVDITDPEFPDSTGVFHTDTSWIRLNNLNIYNGEAFLASSKKGIRIVDISDMHSLKEVGYYFSLPDLSARDVLVENDLVYIASGELFDFTGGDRKNRLIILRLDTPNAIGDDAGPANLNDFTLHQNYPNPFNPSTTIVYELKRTAAVTVTVYDLLGREVVTLVSEQQPAGPQSVTWNGLDSSGQQVVSGIYVYQLKAGSATETRKMMLMK